MAKQPKPVKAWASVSEDVPPEIWQVEFYREHLQDNLRHIRVMVTPIVRKPRKKSAR